MLASKEVQKRRREAFMRRGDRMLQELLTDPERLGQLKRLAKVPDEAPVWFFVVHVGMARLGAEREGRQLFLKTKHGGQGWSCCRETAEATAVRPLQAQLQELQELQRQRWSRAQPAAARAQQDSRRRGEFGPDGFLSSEAAEVWQRAMTSTASMIEEALDELPCVADFGSTLLFVCTNMSHFRGLRPLFRLRLQQQAAHVPGVHRTVAWGQVPLTVEAGKVGMQELEATLYGSKAESKSPKGARPTAGVNLLVETRTVRMGDLRSYGLNIGQVVAAPLPGQEAQGYIKGLPVQASQPSALPCTSSEGLSEALARRRSFRLRTRQLQEDSDSSMEPVDSENSDNSDHSGSETASPSGASTQEETDGESSAVSADSSSPALRKCRVPCVGASWR